MFCQWGQVIGSPQEKDKVYKNEQASDQMNEMRMKHNETRMGTNVLSMFPVDFEWHLWHLERKCLENSGTFKLMMKHLNSGMGCHEMLRVFQPQVSDCDVATVMFFC